jgi:Flp pilus assembly pilin Flp
MGWVQFVKKFIKDERGQAVTEYVLLLSATVVAAGFLAKRIMAVLDSGVLKLGGQLEKDLKTGRAPLNVWKN